MLLFATVAFGMPFILTLYAQQVLGYSAVKFGLTSVVFPAMAAVGSIVGQAIVLRVGFRPVAAAGLALMGAGSLLLTQVSVGGSYFGDIFFGLLVFGPGIGLAFVTASIAALAGVAEHESGLASGLSNTAFQIGAALGVAIVSTVAVSRTDDYLAANADAIPLVALTEGFQSAFSLRDARRDRRGAGAPASRPAAPCRAGAARARAADRPGKRLSETGDDRGRSSAVWPSRRTPSPPPRGPSTVGPAQRVGRRERPVGGEGGFPVIATSSGAIAATLGYEDNDSMPVEEAFGVVARIARSASVPVTADLEAGYGLSPEEVVERLLDAGAVGCNLEDTDHHRGGGLVDADESAERLRAVRHAATEAGSTSS